MKSKVYFIDMRATMKENFIAKIGRLMDAAGIANLINERDLTAVKLHFGEMGNAAFIEDLYEKRFRRSRPEVVRSIEELARDKARKKEARKRARAERMCPDSERVMRSSTTSRRARPPRSRPKRAPSGKRRAPCCRR